MLNEQLFQWALLVFSLLAGIGVILATFKVRYAERFLPHWNDLKELEVTLPVRREELRQTTDERDKRRSEICQLESRIGQLEATEGGLRILKEWHDANPEAPARIQQMMTDLERGNSEKAAIEQKLAQHQQLLNDVIQETSRLNVEKAQLIQEVSTFREQLPKLQTQKAELEKAIQNLDDQQRQIANKLSVLKEQFADAESELARCRSELDQVVQEKRDLMRERDQIMSEFSTAKFNLDSVSKKLEIADIELKQLQGRTETLCKDKRLLEVEVDELIKRRNSVASECLKADEELRKLNSQLEQISRERREALVERDQARADCNAAKAEMAGIQKSIEQLKDLAKGMQANLERAGVTGQGNYSDLFVPVSLAKLPPAPGKVDEKQAVERARDYIRGKGLVFPERMLHAFHTSLKSGDISPLVVLAGISGTGKSELPRHYADGMGIHFMLTAVQPRWDSPQDLFGFYNYLERRYKATELTRALVQFERFNQGVFEDAFEDAEIDDRSDRLLLVLLDEMNLARTEYYFSEFLSKLETRRMVDEQIQSDRARAEIELDMGGSLKDQKTLRLYPARNVLFVGTMNEDESTQSLSDKVIDRASVLRFGRPKKTNPEVTGATKICPKNGLTLKQWMDWIHPPTYLNNHSGEVDTWIEQLNGALDRLGRPFAYRVDRAIRTYIANYPRWVTNWHKRAMADQIEQRIFPKLRGVEPDQGEAAHALRTIGNILDQLDDEPLKKAFAASHQNQSTFLFRGVIRDENE